MIKVLDVLTEQPLNVSTDGTAGPYIIVPLSQLDQLKQLLKQNGVAFSVEKTGISLNGKPVDVVVNLELGANIEAIQRILDSID